MGGNEARAETRCSGSPPVPEVTAASLGAPQEQGLFLQCSLCARACADPHATRTKGGPAVGGKAPGAAATGVPSSSLSLGVWSSPQWVSFYR